jgi:hypothetical protein
MSEENRRSMDLDPFEEASEESAAPEAGPSEWEELETAPLEAESEPSPSDGPSDGAAPQSPDYDFDTPIPGELPPVTPAPVLDAAQDTVILDPAEGGRLQRSWLKRLPFFRNRRRTFVTLFVLIPLFACLSCWLFGFVGLADTAKLVEMSGLVHTRHDDETQWDPATLNQLLGRLQWIRTGTSSGASLVFFDVSTVDLDEETEVRIDQIRRRRGGDGVDVVINMWFGNAAIRAVRFVDPSSAFRVDTPTASTMVRGARFAVQVDEEGSTQIDLEEGSAEVQVGDEVVTIGMGQRITLDPDGLYTTEQLFEPNAQLLIDKVSAAWYSSGDTVELELTDTEINHFLAAMGDQSGLPVRDTQIWFVDGEARIATTLTEPAELEVSAAVGMDVVDGQLELDFQSVAAGVALPVPTAVLNAALNGLVNQIDALSSVLYDYLEFSQVQIGDGSIIIVGTKLPDAPTG